MLLCSNGLHLTVTPSWRSNNNNGAPNSREAPFSVFRDVPALRQYRKQLLLSKRTVGLVPTMGALHDGHLSLIRQAAIENTDVFVSIFVNPTQFGVNEDLDKYPRTWEADIQKLKELDEELASAASGDGCLARTGSVRGRISAIFAPTSNVMYPTLPPTSELDGYGSFVTITPLATLLEGASRPVFFRGVATVCMKLFNIMTPDRVYFGQKDVQQTVIIKRMVKDLHVGTDVKLGPTVREADGLAMSSRNVMLGARRRKVGLVLYKALKEAERAYLSGKRAREEILGPANRLVESIAREQQALPPLERAIFELDYISLADVDSLEELQVVDGSKGAVLSGAVKMLPLESPQPGEDCGENGGDNPVRLIDNIIL
ncbi:pantoate-beta-alanine ligase [Blastomyces gilchristii SLH14081]|uniref:Pantoate--beta-alanine ligase n=1 Tax=Blastomyces gilchristii (strain SLH14081) TaxID=559298 RepID=A0A179UB81_BLAGS|nr:pantoate-beta-alanine ligase [Blastomyces gilchristii SLH14081]OAT04558.1 pantoate-beta-alanine ligase [Blastomyces gilchristii SLH14081]